MHVFIPVDYRSPRGGLQAHVIAQLRAIARAGGQATVMAPAGPFADEVREAGARFVAASDDFTVADAARALETAQTPFDLVHAHPFRARAVGLEVARRARVPFLLTLHSLYSDKLSRYADVVDAVVAVSGAIRDRLVAEMAIPPERIFVIPNGVDTQTFVPAAERVPNRRPRVLVASRLDRDKAFILDALELTWERLRERRSFEIEWLIAGDGTERGKLETAARDLATAAGRPLVQFLGWLGEDDLQAAYASADLCVAPGRCALEAMACGTATIALGSKGYVGLIDNMQAFSGAYSNFGGRGDQPPRPGGFSLLRDVDRAIGDRNSLRRLGDLSRELVTAFFDQTDCDQQMLRLHALARSLGPRFVDSAEAWLSEPELLPPWGTPAWCKPQASDSVATHVDDHALVIRAALSGADRDYVKLGRAVFHKAGGSAAPIEARHRYRLSCDVHQRSGDLHLELWWIEYSADGQRLQHARRALETSQCRLEALTHPRAATVRVALRLAGEGSAVIGPLRVRRYVRPQSAS